MQADLAQIEEIFGVAVAKPDAAARAAYLDQACGDNAELRDRVDALLAAHDASGNFLQLAGGDQLTGPFIELSEGPGARIGRYKLLQQIGEGGFGVVFMAEQEHPVRRRVALKIVKLGMDTRQVVARFEAERQALAMMDHPNIAKVFDAGSTDTGRPYFVMELVRGIPITSFCNQSKWAAEERLRLFLSVCSAVQHAHQKGIIHRDLKPSNVMVTLHDDKAVAKVIDFGVAKATQSRLTEKTLFTEFRQMIGTPMYMSPEQAQMSGLDVDTRSDVYSLGVLLYELLTGTTPYAARDLMSASYAEIQRIIREVEPPTPSSRLSTLAAEAQVVAANDRSCDPKRLVQILRGDLDWIIMKCLEKDRSRRYATASALADDLKRYLTNEPVEARRPTRFYRLKKFVARNKAACAAFALIFSALITGATLAIWGLIVARHDRGIAELAKQGLQTANEQLVSNVDRAETAEKLASKQAQQLGEQLYEIKFPRAVEAFREGQFALARQYLAECPAAQRGWEWHWISRQVGHITPLKISGRYLVEFTADGAQVAANEAVESKSIKFWNASTGAEERKIALSESPLTQFQLSADGKLLATGTAFGNVSLWDVATGRQHWSVKPHEKQIDGFDFSGDGSRLASASWDGNLKVLNIKDGGELAAGRAETELRGASFHPDGKRIVTAGRNNNPTDLSPARVWDAKTGRLIFELPGAARAATYSPDGRLIATGRPDGTAKLYDADTGTEIRTLPVAKNWVPSVVFNSDGTRLATIGDSVVRIWDLYTGQPLTTFDAHVTGVSFLAFAPDGERLVSADDKSVVNVWDTSAIDCFSTVRVDSQADRNSTVTSLAFSSDGTHAVVGTSIGELKFFNTNTLVEERILPIAGCRDAAISPDGAQVAAATGLGTIVVWNTLTGESKERPIGDQGPAESISFSPEGRLLATVGADRTIRLTDAKTGSLLNTLGPTPAGGVIRRAVFRPDGKRLVSAASDGIKVWDVANGSLLYKDTTATNLAAIAFSPDGLRIVAGGKDRALHVWDAGTGNRLPAFAGEHNHDVSSVAFSPDGTRLVSSDIGGGVKIWDANSGVPMLTIREPDNTALQCIKFSPDGNTIAAAAANGTLLVWNHERPLNGYGQRRRAQSASQIAAARLSECDYSQAAIAAIRGDLALSADVRQLAIRLAEVRSTALQDFAEKFLQRNRAAALTPNADARRINDYAWALLTIQPARMRDSAAALPLAEKAVEMSGGNNSMILDTLAEAYFQSGEFANALAIQEKAVGFLSPSAPGRQTYVDRLQRYKVPLSTLPEKLKRQKETLGADDPELLRTMHEVALSDRLAGQFNDAIAMFQETLKLQQQKLGAEHRDTIASTYSLAEALFASGRYSEATELLCKVPEKFVELKAGMSAPFVRRLGNHNAGQMHWREAATLFEMLIAGLEKGGWSFNADEAAMCYLEYAPVLIELGDKVGFDRFRESAIKVFGNSGSIAVGERMLMVCPLLPADERQMEIFEKWSKLAARVAGNSRYRCWNFAALSLWEYRRGNNEQAIEWAEKSLEAEPYPPCRERARALIALASLGLGQHERARASLSECRAAIESKFAGDYGEGTYETGVWRDWLINRILLREADALVETNTPAR